MTLETLKVQKDSAILFVEISAPPMNLLGPALVRDLVSLIQQAEVDDTVRVLVFRNGDPDYFIPHVDANKIKEYREEAAKLTGEASIGVLFRHLSASRLVTIAQIEGRVRGAGSEFVLACDMRFAARESAIFSQPEPALGQIPGAGAVQHLTRLMGRARALEVMLGAEDYNAELAKRYGWINRKAVAEANGCVPHMLQVLNAARKAGLRVFYALHRRYRPGDHESWKYIAPIQKAAWSSRVFEYGTWGGEIRSEFAPQPGDVVALEH